MAFDLNTVVDLPAGFTLEAATGIDNEERIVGEAFDGRQPHGFLLTPTRR